MDPVFDALLILTSIYFEIALTFPSDFFNLLSDKVSSRLLVEVVSGEFLLPKIDYVFNSIALISVMFSIFVCFTVCFKVYFLDY